MTKYRSKTIDIPVDDVECSLEEFETKDIIAELKHRNAMDAEKEKPLIEELSEVHAELMDGRVQDAIALLEKILWPKWRSLDACVDAFQQARKERS